MKQISGLLDAFPTCRVLVVGDLMLDEYLWGHIERISPEAPVPVLNLVRRESMLGGAGNVMRNLSRLGAQVAAVGVVGTDSTGEQILELLDVLGVDSFGDSAVIIKARFKTAPIQQWTVGREMNRRIKKKFDEVGIEIPFPHRSIYWGEASKPFAIRSEQDREELKTLIRDVLAERRPHEQAEDAQRKHPENA